MVENIFFDEVKALSDCVGKYITFFAKEKKEFETVYIISDRNPLGGYIVPALTGHFTDGNTVVVEAFENSSVDRNYCEEKFPGAVYVPFESFRNMKKTEKSAYILLCDTNLVDEKWLDILSVCEEKAKISDTNRIMLGAVLPAMRPIPHGIQLFAEREYSYFLEKTVEDKTPAEKLYIALEKKCRKIVNDGFKKVNVLRFDNLIGTTCGKTPNFDFEEIVKTAFEKGKIEITKEDYLKKYSCIHTRDAACALLKSLYCTRDGHVYNIDLFEVSMADLKQQIQLAFPDKIGVSTDVAPYTKDEIISYCLSNLKAVKTVCFTKKFVYSFENAMYRTICSLSGNDFDVQTRLTCYQGKLQRLKDIEIDILAEIDRICKKHDIKWFLAGGSLLGAVRENKSIPWDDDLDIGMLREDYDKFRKVFEKEMGEQFSYSSPFNKSGSHYTIDKVRLKGTYFSTNFSSKNVTEDGIFIDILVYDKTSNNKLLQKLHMAYLYAITTALEVRWYNEPRKNFHYRASKLALPFLRLIPYRVYHGMFELGVSFYKNKKNAKYLIDSVGKKLIDGVMPIDGLEEVQYVDFDGIKAPIPVDYTGYLNYAYGPNYITMPTYSKRSAPHNFARIDMGEYIFENKEKAQFRSVNIKGELFEEEI